MKVVVTGGAGFIGSHLVELLIQNEDYEVSVIDNLSTGRLSNLQNCLDLVNFVEGDISKNGVWENTVENSDIVFHLAALADIVPSINNPKSYFDSNVIGTANIVDILRKKNNKRIIYAASSSCYGMPSEVPTSENAIIDTRYPYALTKRMAEELIMHYSCVYGFKATSLRLFNVYGPRARTTGAYGAVFGVFLAQKLANRPMTIVGDGTQQRDFTYVTDVADAFMAAASDNSNECEIYNVGTGIATSINSLVEMLGGEKHFIEKRPGEPEITKADITKIVTKLGWCSKVNIETGVNSMLQNIQYWADAPVWTSDDIKKATSEWFKYLK